MIAPPPNPLPRTLILYGDRADPGTLRRLDCARYNGCLDVADRKGWESFHCLDCDAFAPLSPDEVRSDVMQLHELVGAIFSRVYATGAAKRERRKPSVQTRRGPRPGTARAWGRR